MKTKKSFILLAIMMIITSCTLEKRVYNPGYYLEWKNGIRVFSKKEKTDGEINKKYENDERTETTRYRYIPIALDADSTSQNELMIASTYNSQIVLLMNKKNDLLETKSVNPHDNLKPGKKTIKHSAKKDLNIISSKENEPKLNTMVLLGAILFFTGHLGVILAFIFQSWPLLLIWPVGVLFTIIGYFYLKKHPEETGEKLASAIMIAAVLEMVFTLLFIWYVISTFTINISMGI